MKQINQNFLDFLKEKIKSSSFKNNSIICSYYHCFSIYFNINPEDEFLVYLKKQVNEDDFWFTKFHKSLRQTDFFYNGGELYSIERKLFSKKDKEAYDLLIQEALSDDKNTNISENRQKRKELFGKYNKKRRLDIYGHLDMILCETINRDKNSVLNHLILEFFEN